jgi:hypothetical protein
MKTNRTLIGAVALVSFFGLCGAKAQGCGGTVETEPAPAPCAEGSHLENVCQDYCYASSPADSSSGSGYCEETCADQCVPDGACPEGSVEQIVCAQPVSSGSGDSGCASDGTGCYEPSEPGECWTECVPIDPCGAGFHQEWVCEEPQPVSDSGSGDKPIGAEEPSPPPDGCSLICVPDLCPPDMVEQVICEEPVYSSSDCLEGDCEQPAPPAESCWTECLPIDPCGRGYHQETTCTESSEGGVGECTTVCVPDECPPDSIPVEVCTVTDPNGEPTCWTECETFDEPSAS